MAALLLLAGCYPSDYDLVDHKPTGESEVVFVSGEVCEELTLVSAMENTTCLVHSDVERTGVDDFGDAVAQESKITVASVSSGGNTASLFPGSNDVKWAREEWPSQTSFWSQPLTATGSTGAWEVVYELAGLGDLNDISSTSSWLPRVLIDDPNASETYCEDYAPLTLCYDFVAHVSTRRVAEDSECEAGSGTFHLLPMDVYDFDNDGNVTAMMTPIQMSGTGAMTEAAWITSATVLEAQGAELRVSKTGHNLGISPSDQLENASTVSAVLSPNGTTFNAGQVRGGANFVVQEVDEDATAQFEVELEWDCGPVSNYASAPTGYVFNSDSLNDCLLDVPQSFVVRPRFEQGVPKSLQVQAYGRLDQWITVPVVQVGNTHAFSFQHLGLVLSGSVDDWSPTELELTIDTIAWEQVDLCDAGSVTLPASE